MTQPSHNASVMAESSASGRGGLRAAVARIVLPYACVAGLWILVSDRAIARLFPDPVELAAVATFKGFLFVAVTAASLWGLLRIELSRRVATEAALAEATARLQRAQQVANVGHWVWHLQSHRLEWSDQMYRIFGVDPDLASGDLLEVATRAVHPEDRSAVHQANRRVLDGHGPTSLEYRLLRPDGSLRTVWAESADVKTAADGTPVTLSGIVQDITDRKQLEQQFLRAQRTEAVGALASGIAHDLNNILTPVMMIAPLLRASVTTAEDRSLTEMLEQCARRGADILKQLLTFARGDAGARAALSMAHLMREMVAIARETFPREIQISTDIAPDLWPADGDSTQMHQVLMNLCINARDAMPAGGLLCLAAANVTLTGDETALMPEPRPGRYVRLTVTDTGEGIQAEHLGRIFDPFFTTKEPGKGTGLGLATVLGIVRSHAGLLGVESVPGEGTRFHVYLPASMPASADAPAATVTTRDGAGAMVLVVEDEAGVRHLVEQTLVAAGYRVTSAINGLEGLVAYERHRADVRAVVTDMMMPGMSGDAMIAALRARGIDVPILAVSGAHTAAPLSAGPGLMRLAKPFTPSQLLLALEQAMRASAPPQTPPPPPARRGVDG